ncbi:single-stranded DNA-binding protein [Methylacidiphilales bacterium]|nr:single-stranded DNA-binding protein [Candidatus Methylacidiphilales bacterium]
MANLNKVLLMGNLTRDPEVRYTPKGTAVGDLAIAINDSYKAQDGTVKETVTYVDIEVWGRQAETCKQYLTKGRPIFVEGQLRLDQWETPQGEKKRLLRVRADRVQFLGGGGGGGGSRSGGNAPAASASSGESTRPARPSSTVSEEAPPLRDEDDIPF